MGRKKGWRATASREVKDRENARARALYAANREKKRAQKNAAVLRSPLWKRQARCFRIYGEHRSFGELFLEMRSERVRVVCHADHASVWDLMLSVMGARYRPRTSDECAGDAADHWLRGMSVKEELSGAEETV